MGLDVMCPKCHRIFTVEKIRKELVGESSVRSIREEEYLMGEQRQFGVGAAIPAYVQPETFEELKIFKLYLKCRHCGHEWVETKQEAIS